MKKIIIFAFLASLLMAPAAMADDGGWVFAVKGGYAWSNMDEKDLSGPQGLTDNNATAGSFSEDDGWMAGVAFGYDWSDQGVDMRTELEYTYYGADADFDAQNATSGGGTATLSGDIDSIQTLMLNVYYDFETDTAWTPYIGVGVGLAFISADLNYSSNWRGAPDNADLDETNFAWDASLGVAYEVTDTFTVDFAGRYTYMGDIDYSDDGADGKYTWSVEDISTFETVLGLRFTF